MASPYAAGGTRDFHAPNWQTRYRYWSGHAAWQTQDASTALDVQSVCDTQLPTSIAMNALGNCASIRRHRIGLLHPWHCGVLCPWRGREAGLPYVVEGTRDLVTSTKQTHAWCGLACRSLGVHEFFTHCSDRPMS